MNATYDRLDEAIDQVAKRMTHVAEDDSLAARIANALPERSAWSVRWLMPRLAITAGLAALAIAVVLRTFDDRPTDVLRSAVLSLPAVELGPAALEHRTTVELPPNLRRTIVERPSYVRRTTEDHERSLEALAAPLPLALGVVEPSDLPGQSPLIVAPLAIPDLALTAENNFPR